MLNMVWGSVTAYMGIDSLTPLVKDLKTALGDVSESSVMDAAKAISRSDGCVYFMDARSMSVNNSPTITLYDLSRSIYPVVETDYGVYADVHSFLEFGETIVTDF